MYLVSGIEYVQMGDLNYPSDNIFFSGCSIGCPYCFNKDAPSYHISHEDLLSQIKKYSTCDYICLMGGEPTEQDITQLVIDLYEMGKKIVLFSGREFATYIYNGNIMKDIEYYEHIHIDLKPWRAFTRREYYMRNTKSLSLGLVASELNMKHLGKININEDRDLYIKPDITLDEPKRTKLAEEMAKWIKENQTMLNVSISTRLYL